MSAPRIAVEEFEDVEVPAPSLSSAVERFIDELARYATAKLSHQQGEWLGNLERAVASRGPFEQAAVEAAKAQLQGKNPVWAGAKGAWAGATVPQRVVTVAVLVLLVVLAPVPLVLLILGLLIAALVAAIRAAKA